MATTNKVKGWTGVLMTEDSSSHWPIKRRYVYSETSRRAGLELVCIFGHDAHTLITMRHLVNDPANLPDVPAVREFTETIGQTLPKTRMAALCFDKLDVETGCDMRSPEGAVRRLKQPWSLLAYQLAGDEGSSSCMAKARQKSATHRQLRTR